MSQLRLVTWNAEGMFVEGSMTRRASPSDALRIVKELDADVLVIPEFGIIDQLADLTRTELERMRYSIHTTVYRDPRARGSGLAILSRLPVVSLSEVTLESQIHSIVDVVVEDKGGRELRILGVHLDDRQEAYRLDEVAAICANLDKTPVTPIIMAGDSNAMHERSWFARLIRLRIVGSAAKRFPSTQAAGVLARAHEMGFGTTIRYIERQGSLRSLDPGLQRTISAKQRDLEWMPSWRLAKIDWIFGSKEFTVASYRVLRDVGSDHRPVVADLNY